MEYSKINVGITGQPGFIGTHLFNYLGLKENINRIPFKDEFFYDSDTMDNFVKQCDVIVHLAAMNRHNDPKVLYETNINLTKTLISSLKRTNSEVHVIISSSIQESRDNPYGKSKRISRELLKEWAKSSNGKFTGLLIPNVFGPFGKPFYNSFIATFSHLIIQNEKPKIEVDADIDLIYVQDLLEHIYKIIKDKVYTDRLLLSHIATAKVSDVLAKLYEYHSIYVGKGIIPNLDNYFELCLFNTFRSYLPKDYFPKHLKLHTDNRGSFVETVKTEGKGQFSFSTTKPGITRGNHFHTRKVERFAVIKGNAVIKLRRIGTNEVITYHLDGDNPSYVDMPVWYTHNITNIGNDDLITLFWISEIFDKDNPDTFYENVE